MFSGFHFEVQLQCLLSEFIAIAKTLRFQVFGTRVPLFFRHSVLVQPVFCARDFFGGCHDKSSWGWNQPVEAITWEPASPGGYFGGFGCHKNQRGSGIRNSCSHQKSLQDLQLRRDALPEFFTGFPWHTTSGDLRVFGWSCHQRSSKMGFWPQDEGSWKHSFFQGHVSQKWTASRNHVIKRFLSSHQY